jgi:hypothetical protein
MLELWAVDLPELYHLNDVIVFSIQGERTYVVCMIYSLLNQIFRT